MKLKVCFCNKTVLRTDITRFAPLWGGYTLLLAAAVMMSMTRPGLSMDDYYDAVVRNFSAWAGKMTPINGLYALGVVGILWSDLLNPRMCNSLHAMPVTRDGYFGAHLVAALLFALVPNTLVFGASALTVKSTVVSAPLLALGAASLQYIFYLGMALVAVQLAGNRIGTVLTYGMLNFCTILVYWFCAQVFAPLLYGVELDVSWVAKICPTVAMYKGSYFTPNSVWDNSGSYRYLGMEMGDLFPHAILYAIAGIVLIGIAQLLYRKRKLEVAGDLLAYRFLSPVFLVLYTLMVAAFVHLGVQRFAQGSISQYWFLPLGLLAGYVSGLMLLRRTSRVFRKRLLIPLLGILCICVLAVGAIYIDLFGLIRYVPEMEDIESVNVNLVSNYGLGESYASREQGLTLTDSRDIETVLRYQKEELSDWKLQVKSALRQADNCWKAGDYYNVRLFYRLRNGRTLARRYAVHMSNPAMDDFKKLLCRPEIAFGCTEDRFRELVSTAQGATYYLYEDPEQGIEGKNLWYADTTGLADAILADCREGNFQNFNSRESWMDSYTYRVIGSVNISNQGDADEYFYVWVNLLPESTHTFQWLNTHEGSSDIPRG